MKVFFILVFCFVGIFMAHAQTVIDKTNNVAKVTTISPMTLDDLANKINSLINKLNNFLNAESNINMSINALNAEIINDEQQYNMWKSSGLIGNIQIVSQLNDASLTPTSFQTL